MSKLVRFAALAVTLAVFIGAGCKKKNSAPESPQVTGPGLGKPGSALTFGFTSTDPDGDSVSYMISWGDGTPTVWSSSSPSGDQFAQTHVYSDSGAYFVKAKAKDSHESESGWSDSVQVAVGFFAPHTPARPIGPTACTTGIAYTYRTRAVHPLGDSVALQFSWGDTLGDWGPMVASNSFYEAAHVFETLGTYRVAARARDAHGLESAWSEWLVVEVDTVHGNPGRAPYDLILTAATDTTVNLTWSAPADSTPSRYVVSFRETGTGPFDSVGGTQSLNFVHDPAHRTGQYQVAALYDSVRYTSSEIRSTIPTTNSMLRIPELNGNGKTGYGWSRITGEVTMYDMTVVDSAPKVDFYTTDFAPGYAGPYYWLASPFLAPSDPGGGIPAANWHITEFTHLDSLATEDSLLPRYLLSRYRDRSIIDSLPRLVACHTEDGHFGLVRASAIDTINGTADVETWFQLVPGLRLIEH